MTCKSSVLLRTAARHYFRDALVNPGKPLNEAAGANNALDLHTNGLTLTQTSSPGSDTGKVYSTARTFDGAFDYFTRNSETLLQTGDVDFTIAEIKQCEFLIDRIYKEAGVKKSHKCFRYPHVDRGTGSWVIDYDLTDAATTAAVRQEIEQGVNLQDKNKPAPFAFEKKQQLHN